MEPSELVGDRRLGRSLGRRRSAPAEAAAFAAFYALYEVLRGVVAGGSATAVGHGRDVASLEMGMHVFVEPSVARAAAAIPGLVGTLSISYLTLHFGLTTAALVWLHRRRPLVYPIVRNTLLIASGLALVGYLVFPTAPPRLAHLSIRDAVSTSGVSLNHGLISSLYNPYAAVPSLHTAYAVIIGSAIALTTRRVVVRVAAVVYPAFVVFTIVATGNHFFIDAAAGLAVAVGAYALSVRSFTGGVAAQETPARCREAAQALC